MSTATAQAHGLTSLILQNESLLRAIKREEASTPSWLAGETGRDLSNLSKSLKILEAEDLIAREPIRLTEAGEQAVAALDRAAGNLRVDEAPPAGHVALRFDEIEFDPDNARTDTGLEAAIIDEFADSIAEKGILQKPRVRSVDGRWRLVMGERRVRAWGRLIERGTWPADHVEVLAIHQGDPAEFLEAGLVENLQRADLNNLEIAEGLLLLHERHHRTVKQLTRMIGNNRTDRFVQICLKVAKGASAEDKARYVESERAYRAAKAKNETIKRTFTWEDLRDTVTVAKHITALEKRDRLTLLVAELALKAFDDVNALHRTPNGEFVGAGRITGLTRISVPPGGGHWSSAETLGLVVDDRAGGDVLAAITPLAEAWIREQIGAGDGKIAGEALLSWVTDLRVEVLGAFGEQLRKDGDAYGTTFLKPPKPTLPPAPAPTPAEPETPEHLVGLQVQPDIRPPPRDDFAAAVREVNDQAQKVPAALDSDAAREAALRAAAPAPLPPEPALPAGGAHGLKDPEYLALVEVIHKTTKEGVEARGGQLRGAKVASDFASSRDALAANGLAIKRLIMFIQAASGTGFICVPTQAAWDLVEAVDDERLEGTHEETLPRDKLIEHEASGLRYYTSWLTVPPAPKAERETPTAEEPADRAEALDDDDGGLDVGEILARQRNFLLTFARQQDGVYSSAAFESEVDARELGQVLADSGQYEEIFLNGRDGALLVEWGRQ